MAEKPPRAQSRREFVKNSAVVGTAAAVGVGESPFSIRTDQSQAIEWDRRVDVVVIGAGAGGFAGAFAITAVAAFVAANVVGFGLRETLHKDEPEPARSDAPARKR